MRPACLSSPKLLTFHATDFRLHEAKRCGGEPVTISPTLHKENHSLILQIRPILLKKMVWMSSAVTIPLWAKIRCLMPVLDTGSTPVLTIRFNIMMNWFTFHMYPLLSPSVGSRETFLWEIMYISKSRDFCLRLPLAGLRRWKYVYVEAAWLLLLSAGNCECVTWSPSQWIIDGLRVYYV